MASGVGDRFQVETKYVRGSIPSRALNWADQPEALKTYPDAPQFPLTSPNLKGGLSLWKALQQRRSLRRFGGAAITRAELSRLLWAAQGVTRREHGYLFRTAPSAGALYPIETYLALHRAEDLQPGIYHYNVAQHALEQLLEGDYRAQTARAALDQRIAYEADLVMIWTAVFLRSKFKYGQRAFRYVYLDAGHIAENVALGAVALGLGSCQIAALYDDEANALLGVDGESESVVYMTAVGREA